MAEKMLMLALSPTMEKGVIVKWHKREGDSVASGEVIADVETDKAVMEYQAGAEGTLLKILVPEGGSAAVEEPIAIVGQPGEDVSALLGMVEPRGEAEAKASAGEACPITPPRPAEPTVEARPPAQEARVRISPVALKMAEEAGIDVGTIKGSGPEGRIVKTDVERAMAAGPARKAVERAPAFTGPLQDETVPVSPKRKVIAERLASSKFSAPHYYLRVSAVVDGILEARSRHNAQAAEKVSLNAFFMKLAAEAIRRHPAINSTWSGDSIIRHGRIDIALAVAQPDGLVAPVVRDCGNKGVLAIDAELRELIDRAKGGRLTGQDMEGATFTISNLGSFGIESFTAIINPPGAAILAVGAAVKRPVVNEQDEIVARTMMELTLSCDHRLIDGAVGAAFLKDLKAMMETPILALL